MKATPRLVVLHGLGTVFPRNLVIELACHDQGTAAMTRCEYLNLSFGHQNPIPDPDDFMNHLTGG